MSLLKVSLCVNRLKQRPLCMDTRRGAGVSAIPPHGKTKFLFFSAFLLLFFTGRVLCYVFLLMRGFFHRMETFLLLFLYVGGLFATSSSWCGAFFIMLGPFLLLFSPCGGDFFVFMVDFMSLWLFYGLAPSPYNLFCGHMLLCNFHPMFSAITYSGHYK